MNSHRAARSQAGACDVHSSARGQHLVRIPIVWEMLKRLAPKGDLFFLHYLDVLPPHGSGRFTQSECLLRQVQMVCCKRRQIFGHARLGTLLGEPYAPFGQLSMVFGSQHSRTMTAATASLNLNHGKRFKFD
jgi:hypothetical protein